MRALISSLISDGLSWWLPSVVPLVPASPPAFQDELSGLVAPAPAASRDELAAQRAVDDDVAGIDHRAADQRLRRSRSRARPRGRSACFSAAFSASSSPAGSRAAEVTVALTTRSASRLSSSNSPAISGSSAQPAVVGEQREEAARTRSAAPSGDSSATASACGQLRVAEQRARRADRRRRARRTPSSSRPVASAFAVLRQRERGAGVRTGEGEGLAHRSDLLRRARRAAPCGALASISRRSSFSAPVTASADDLLAQVLAWRGCDRPRSRPRPAPSGGCPRRSRRPWPRRRSGWRAGAPVDDLVGLRARAFRLVVDLVLRLRERPSARLSAAARPSAIFCWRSSMAAMMCGQMNFITSHATAKNAKPWMMKVRLIFIAVLLDAGGASRRRSRTRLAISSTPQRAEQERVGEDQQQRDRDADDRHRVEQAGDDEHLGLQHRGQLRLAGRAFQELAAEDARSRSRCRARRGRSAGRPR